MRTSLCCSSSFSRRGAPILLRKNPARGGDWLGYFRHRLRDSARAERIAQEVFRRVLRGIENTNAATFRTYLYSIAFRQVPRIPSRKTIRCDFIRASRRRAAGSCEAIWVRRAVEKLDEQHKEVLMLREYEQLSYDEIAALLRHSGQHRALQTVPRTNGVERIAGSRSQ